MITGPAGQLAECCAKALLLLLLFIYLFIYLFIINYCHDINSLL